MVTKSYLFSGVAVGSIPIPAVRGGLVNSFMLDDEVGHILA